MAIELVVDDVSLDLEDREISFELVSPLFSRDIGWGSWTHAFDLPDTPRNRRALGFWNAVSIDSLLKPVAQVKLGGALWREGVIQAESGSPDARRMKGAVVMDTAALQNLLGDVYFSQLNLGEYDWNSETRQVLLGIDHTSDPISITINGYVHGTNIGAGETARDAVWRLVGEINAHPDVKVNVVANGTQATFSTITITQKDPIFPAIVEPDGQNWIIFQHNMYASDYLTDTYAGIGTVGLWSLAYPNDPHPYPGICFPLYENPDYYIQGITNPPNANGYAGIMNYHDPINGTFEALLNDENRHYFTAWTPFIFVHYLLEKGLQAAGFRDVSSFTQSAAFRSWVLYTNKGMDAEIAGVNYCTVGLRVAEHIRDDFSLANLVGDMLASFNLAAHIDPVARTIDFRPRQAVAGGQEKDWRAYNTTAYGWSRNTFKGSAYEWENYPNEDDGYEWKRPPVPAGVSFKKLARSPLVTKDLPGLPTGRGVYIEQESANGLRGGSGAEIAHRYCWYHGPISESGGLVCYATSDGRPPAVTDPDILPSLQWDGNRGLWASYYADFDDVANAERVINAQLTLPLSQIINIDWTRPVRLQVNEGEFVGILRRVKFALSPNHAGPVLVDVEVLPS